MESRAHRPTLRRGSAARAGLLQEPLDQLVRDAEAYLADSPKHPWYAGAVLLAGRGGTVALHRPVGKAVRYAAYDEKSDTGVEFPADQQIPMAEDTVFDLASISKLFTSLLAVQQIERGRLVLEATVASYLPDFAGGGKQGITVRHLLTHTSGFRSWIPLYKEPTREGKLRMLWDEVPASTPGSAYLYSDLNLISLQLILEQITGRTLDVLLARRSPPRSGCTAPCYNPPASWKPKIAATEDARLPWSGLERGLVWGEVHDENAFGFGGVAGHAGVFSCAWDLAVLARTLLNGGCTDAPASCPRSPWTCCSPTSTPRSRATSTASASSSTSTGTWARWRPRAVRGTPDSPGPAWCSTRRPTPFSSCWATPSTPVRSWRSGSAHPGWRPPTSSPGPFRSGPSGGAPPVVLRDGERLHGHAHPARPAPESARARLECALWWDTEPASDGLFLEASAGGEDWQPVPFTTARTGPGHRIGPRAAPGGHGDRLVGSGVAPAGGGPVGLARHESPAAVAVHHGPALRGARRVRGRPARTGRGPHGLRLRAAPDAWRIGATGWALSAD